MLLKTEHLREWCGYSRKADIERWLRENGIAWRRGKDGEICTTLEAVNQSLQSKDKMREAQF